MTINFNTEPYNDDYDAEKDFYRILFRPSYAVQARELTQLQTILQNQVSRFGDHVFKNGSQVIPGSVNVDDKIHFIKLEITYNTANVLNYLTSFRDKIITGSTSGVKLRVIDTSNCECVVDDVSSPTLYCKIENTAEDGTTKRLIPGENIIALEADNQIETNYKLTEDQAGDIGATVRSLGDNDETATSYTNDPSSDVLGFAYGVDIKAGIYYVDGFFVRNSEKHLYIGRFSPTIFGVDENNQPQTSCRVGFKVIEEVVAPEDDETLLDNAQGSFNFAAPGAHRYKISLDVLRLPLNYTPDNTRFIELLRIVDGRIQRKITTSSYAELEKTLARRTYDESGNYEVNKFKLSVRDHLDNGSNFGVYPETPQTPVAGVTYGDPDKFVVVVDPGKAYVQGYEVEAVASQFVELNKARENSITGDEGGHIFRLDDQPIPTQNGNYVLVKNLYKLPTVDSFERVYLVKKLNAVPGSAPASSDVVGTARIKGVELHSADYTAGTSTVYKLGLIDVNMYSGFSFEVDVKQLTGTGTTGVFTCDINPSPYTLLGSATTSTSSQTVTGVGTNFVSSIVAGDVLYVNNVLIGTVSTTPTNNLSLNLTANAAATVSGGIISVFRAEIFESEYSSLIYRVGPQFVKTLRGWDGTADTQKSTQVTVRRIFSPYTVGAAGTAEFSLTNTNEFFLSDSDLSNYLVINNTTNLPVNITTASITFDNDTNRKTVTFSGLTTSVSYSLIASVLQINLAGQEKTKTLNSNFEQTITGAKFVTGNTVELSKADVLRIKNVYMTAGNYTAYSDSGRVDITDRYTLDDGQRSAYYTNSKLVLKPGFQVPSGAIKVVYDYFQVSGTGNYFSVDSYSTIDYDLIPNYFTIDPSTGKKTEICLSCVLDYRPIIAGDNTWYPQLPKIGTDANAPIAFYVGRQDKLVLDSVGRFNVIQGVPSLLPQEPEDPKEGLVLASIYIPPYTKFVDSVKVYQRDNRRYTMKDIGKLDRRITNLEYYVSLNLLEKDTATLQIKDTATGLDKFKNGFIVDQFTGHGIGDVKNADYKIAVDSQSRRLRPMHFTTALDIVEDLVSGSARSSAGYQKTNDIVTLPYTESTFIFNNVSSRTIDVNPYKIGAFKGEVVLLPAGDNWKDTDRRPNLLVTDDNNYDAIRYLAEELGVTGAQWNEWETNWTGVSSSTNTWQTGDPSRQRQRVTGYETTITTQTGTQSREGILTKLQSTVNSQDYGDRVVDMGFTPFMRARPIVVVAKNLKSNTRFWAFFDTVAVSEYCQPADSFRVIKTSGASLMSFADSDLQNNVLADDSKRAYNGQLEPAFSVGDVLTNSTHTATNITAVANLAAPAASFTITVSSSSGILAGHHVVLYNLNFHNARTDKDLFDLSENQIIPASVGITSTTTTSKELNLKKFKVLAVNSNTVTLGNIDGSDVAAFSAYNTASYSGSNRGKLLRLKASAVVVYDGFVYSSDANGYPLEQDLRVVNIKNGFAVGEVLTGSVLIGNTSSYNSVTLSSINESTSTSTPATMKAVGDAMRADIDGAVVAVFYLPNNNSISFRTGERTFKLIDNISNSDIDFDSKGSAVYYSQGITLTKERTVVNTRTAEFVQDRLYEQLPVRRTSSSTRQIYSYFTGHDPIAQTFTVNSTGGVFVTSIDVFFSEAGNRPITVEIRTTNSGVPSTKVIPFSDVTLTPQQINVSEDGSAASTFAFKAPIYLQDAETYAVVVKTDEPGCQVFVSELGKTDLITDQIITAQPLTGSLFLSQNSQEFEINPLLDLKFTLRKAVFQTNTEVNVDLRANPPLNYILPNNPFEITPSTNKVRVYAPNHGFVAGEIITLSGLPDGNYGTSSSSTGIPASVFNTKHTVLSSGLEKDSFVIEMVTVDGSSNSLLVGSITNANFVKGEYGGNTVLCTRSLHVDGLYLKTSDLNFQDTSMKYYVNAEDSSGAFTGYQPIVSNSNYFFSTRKHVKTYDNQTVITANPLTKRSSLRFRAALSSSNPNVSPVIDLQKLSAYAISNLVNNDTQSSINVPEIDSRNLLVAGNVLSGDISTAGTGSLSSSTASTAITGVSTQFLTQVKAGNVLKRTSDNVTIGTVSTVNSNTSITLTGNAAITTSGIPFTVVSASTLNFSNSNGYGVISTNIDTADNLLANAVIGKYITITNANSNVNGTYVITNVINESDSTTFAGNTELDKINVFVSPAFAGSASIDMITDNDFSIKMLDKYVEDFAPVGSHNYANYITRTLSLANAAEALKIMFDASIVNKTNIKVYYRVWAGDADLRKLPYVDSGFSNDTTDIEGSFSERSIDLTNLSSFTNVSIKLVMKSTDPAAVPLVKNFRMIAYS